MRDAESPARTERERREEWWDELVYTCDDCNLEIRGHSGDPQEAPYLYCPECDEQMELEVNWHGR